MTLKTDVRALFQGLTSQPGIFAQAPGRVNLIGEHTDYSGGYVLPLALELCTAVQLAINTAQPGTLMAHSREEGATTAHLNEAAAGKWTDYICGAVGVANELGANISSLIVAVASDVPLGAGVSSSAALEVAMLRALREAAGIELSDKDLAYAAQRIENQHLGLQTGIMDQMASSLGEPGAPMLFDTHAGTTENLPMFKTAQFVTFHSGVSRKLVEGAYNERRSATDQALETLKTPRLVELSAAQVASLPANIQPRVRHVNDENARVLAAATALRANDAQAFGTLMSAAHASMRDDFAASHETVDAQVALAERMGAYGARITGAGFGGSFVVLTDPALADTISQAMVEQFPGARRLT